MIKLYKTLHSESRTTQYPDRGSKKRKSPGLYSNTVEAHRKRSGFNFWESDCEGKLGLQEINIIHVWQL